MYLALQNIVWEREGTCFDSMKEHSVAVKLLFLKTKEQTYIWMINFLN